MEQFVLFVGKNNLFYVLCFVLLLLVFFKFYGT